MWGGKSSGILWNKPRPLLWIIVMYSVQSLSKEMFHRTRKCFIEQSMCMRLMVSSVVLNTELIFKSISFLEEKLQT